MESHPIISFLHTIFFTHFVHLPPVSPGCFHYNQIVQINQTSPHSAAFYFFLRLFLFSQHPAAIHGGNSLNENHILELRGVMGCEVGVCLSICGSILFELAACIKQVRGFYPNRTTDLIKGMSKCDQIKSSGYFKQELSPKRFLHST